MSQGQTGAMKEPPRGKDGAFERKQSKFRNWVTADGSSGFKAEPDRYHLYISYACPWAHRSLVFRKLKGLEDVISYTPARPLLEDPGWSFLDDDGKSRDGVNGFENLMQAYEASEPGYDGRATTPTLWDRKTGKIVSNESADVIRMLNSEFNAFARHPEVDMCPPELRADIDRMNERTYESVNNGVYKCGFATSQSAYEKAFDALFETLDGLEEHLREHRYLVGDRLTEADWRLWATLIRFDSVYHGHFKANLRRIVDYPSLWGFTRELYQMPGIDETVHLQHIKEHYYRSHVHVNPTRIVPKGPALDLRAPHGREHLPVGH